MTKSHLGNMARSSPKRCRVTSKDVGSGTRTVGGGGEGGGSRVGNESEDGEGGPAAADGECGWGVSGRGKASGIRLS